MLARLATIGIALSEDITELQKRPPSFVYHRDSRYRQSSDPEHIPGISPAYPTLGPFSPSFAAVIPVTSPAPELWT